MVVGSAMMMMMGVVGLESMVEGWMVGGSVNLVVVHLAVGKFAAGEIT